MLRDVYDKDYNLHSPSGKDEGRPFRVISYRPEEDEFTSSQFHAYAERYRNNEFWNSWHMSFEEMLQLPRYLADDLLQKAYRRMMERSKPPTGGKGDLDLSDLEKELSKS